MIDKGIAHIGIGKAKGDDKAIEAVKQAVSSPLLETTIEGASHVIINISGDISLIEANDAASYVQELAGDDANIIFGAMYDENAQDEASITVIATGLDEHNATSSVSKVMSGLNSYKAQPAEKSASNEAAATETAAPTFTKPAQQHLTAHLHQILSRQPDIPSLNSTLLQLSMQEMQEASQQKSQQLRHRKEPLLPSARQQTKRCRSISRISKE